MNTQHPSALPALPATSSAIRHQIQIAAQALQCASYIVDQAAEKQPLRYGTLAAGLAITRQELKFAARRWMVGSAV